MAQCEQNITALPLSLTYPSDTDLVIFTDSLGNTVVKRWSVIKPIPLKHTEYATATVTQLDIPALNGVVFSRLFDIQRSGSSCSEIVNTTPVDAQIQFVPSSGGNDAAIIVSSDNPLGFGEWIKIIWI